MSSPTLEQLRTLVAAVDKGSFDAAAEHLHVTASAVSQRIRALEDAAGRVLLRRERPITPTAPGEELLRTARQMLHLEDSLGRLLGGGADDAQAIVVPVAANADSLATWFVDALTSVPIDPGTTFDVRREDEAHSADLLRRGEVMAAVTSEARPVQGCRVEELGSMRYLACASPAFVERWLPGGVTRAALGRVPVVDFDRKDSLQARFTRRLTHAQDRGPRHYIPSTHDFHRAVVGGLGWALVPELIARDHLRRGELVPIAPDEPMDVPLYWQSWKVRSDVLRDLTVAVREAARRALRPPCGTVDG